MKMIITKGDDLVAVRAGVKRQTLRFWRKDRKIRVGELVLLSNYKDKLVVRVTACYKKPLDSINLDEAVANGHLTVEALQNTVRSIYGVQNFLATIVKYERVT